MDANWNKRNSKETPATMRATGLRHHFCARRCGPAAYSGSSGSIVRQYAFNLVLDQLTL